MRIKIGFILILLCTSLSAQSILDKFEPRIHSAYGKTIPYRLFIPENYSSQELYPLIMTLHGAGERGTDNALQITTHRIAAVWVEDSIQQDHPCFIVSPQCPPEYVWYDQSDLLSNILVSLMEEFPIDVTRLYITGLSLGGYGTWDMITFSPFRFAAAVPICGGGTPAAIPFMTHIPAIWNFHGRVDFVVSVEESRLMIAELEALGLDVVYTDCMEDDCSGMTTSELDSALQAGAKFLYTEYQFGSHNIWDWAYNSSRLHTWMFSQALDSIPDPIASEPTSTRTSNLITVGDSPVVDFGAPGSWDAGGIYNPVVIKEGDTLKMWYVGWGTGFLGLPCIGYTWSINGKDWQRFAGNPVFVPQLIWEGDYISEIALIKDGDIYKMWYGANMVELYPAFIGYATSQDGINWIRHADPVLQAGEIGDWDYNNIAPGTVIKENGTYKMWYYGGNRFNSFQIGYATSSDGITWVKYNDPATTKNPYANSDPVLKVGRPGVAWDYNGTMYPTVLQDEMGYEMWYMGAIMWDGAICYSTSQDGIEWYKSESNPILYEKPAWSEEGWYYGGAVLHFDYQTHLWYSYTDSWNYPCPRIGYAVDFSRIAHADSFIIDRTYVSPSLDTLNINAWINNPATHSLTVQALVASDDQTESDSVQLFDDGIHNDGAAGDGLWGGGWPATSDERFYSVHIQTVDLDTGSIHESDNYVCFTTVGPVNLMDYEILSSDTVANPGDIINILITLKNESISDTIKNIKTILFTSDSAVARIQRQTLTYEDIAPGSFMTSMNSARITFSNDVEGGRLIYFNITIFSEETKYWDDSLAMYLNPTDIEKISEIIPRKSSLAQNYPNPFNPKTIISWQVGANYKSPVHVELNIYNILGQKVATLVNKFMPPGYYKKEFDGQNLSSGVYMYRIQAGSYSAVKKMVLIR